MMDERNLQHLVRSNQEYLQKYSSDIIKKGLTLAKKIEDKQKNNQAKVKFWVSLNVFGKDYDYVSSISISGDGKKLATYSLSGLDDVIVICDLHTSNKLTVLKGREPICMSQDGNYLSCFFACNELDELQDGLAIYDINTGAIVRNFECIDEFFDGLNPGAISPIFDQLAWINYDNEVAKIIIFDLKKSKIKYSFFYPEDHEDYDISITFSSNGRFLSLSNSESNNVYVIDTHIGKILNIVDLSPLCSKAPAVISPNGKMLIAQSFSLSGSLILDVEKKKIISFISDDSTFGSPNSCYCYDWSGNIIVKGSSFGGIEILKCLTYEEISNDFKKKAQVIEDLSIVANFYFQKKEYDEAEKFYNELIDLNENKHEFYLNRGKCNYLQGNLAEAYNDFSKSIDLDKNFAESYFQRAITLSQLGEFESAINDLLEVLKLDSSFEYNYYYFYVRAAIFNDMGMVNEALNDVDKALSINREDIDGYILKGKIYLQDKNYDRVIDCMNTVISNDPLNKSAHIMRGLAYFDLGNKAQTVEDLKNIDLSSEEFNLDKLLWIRGCAYFDTGITKEAIQDLNDSLNINPNLIEALFSRGFIFHNLGLYDKAINDFTKILEINPENHFAYNQRSSARSASGDYQGAIEDLQKSQQFSQKS